MSAHEVLRQHMAAHPESLTGSQALDLMSQLAGAIAESGDRWCIFVLLCGFVRHFAAVPEVAVNTLEHHLAAIEDEQ